MNPRHIFCCCVAVILAATAAFAQTPSAQDPAGIDPADYTVSKRELKKALRILDTPLDAPLVFPNPAPGAQWFPEAGLGLFLHWGIHSCLGAQPSWNMIKGYEWAGEWHSREEYYGQAFVFHPVPDPFDNYLKAAKEAGFAYAVLTTRHHDGYALWPSKYGIGTKQYLQGRDLVREYVEACRRQGLRVGLYYSPRDWHYPGDRPLSEFDVSTWGKLPPVQDTVANRKAFEAFFAYVCVQLEELLTRYGKIDVLWLDGMGWRGIPAQELQTERVYAWIRSLQPDIVINDRWANLVDPDNPDGTGMRIGDFTTPFECTKPTYVPSAWWDECHIWNGKGGGWGYNKKGLFKPLSWFMEHFVAARSLGGNFLINVGPSGSGDMHPNYYQEIDRLKDWMVTGAESVFGTGPTPGVERSNAPLTTRGADIWYIHVLPDLKRQVSVKTDRIPAALTLLRTSEAVPYLYRDGFLVFQLRPEQRTETDDVVKLVF